MNYLVVCFFFSSRRRHTRFDCDWSSDVCSSDLLLIISHGKIVADGPVDRLIQQAEGAVEISVEVAGAGVAEALGQLPGVRRVEPGRAADGRVAVTLTADGGTDLRPEIFALAKARGWTLYELHAERAGLEELFHQLTQRDASDA